MRGKQVFRSRKLVWTSVFLGNQKSKMSFIYLRNSTKTKSLMFINSMFFDNILPKCNAKWYTEYAKYNFSKLQKSCKRQAFGTLFSLYLFLQHGLLQIRKNIESILVYANDFSNFSETHKIFPLKSLRK